VGAPAAGEDGAEARQEVRPDFTREIKALDTQGREALRLHDAARPGAQQKRFLLAAYPPHCAFCLPSGPESLVEVIADTPIEFTYRADRGLGRLAVLENDVVYYRSRSAARAALDGDLPPSGPGPPATSARRAARAARPPGPLGPRNTTPRAADRAGGRGALSRRHSGRRAALLKAEIKDPVGGATSRRGSCSSTCYQMLPNREEFDALSMLLHGEVRAVAARMERRTRTCRATRACTPKERKDFFALQGSARTGAEIGKLRTFAERRARCASTCARSRDRRRGGDALATR
jgi:hypothetical protein